MKKISRKALAVVMSVVMALTCMGVAAFNTASAAPSNLPVNVIVGYWHDFDNGSTTTKLGDVNPNWDVVIASFLTTGGDYCTASFEPDDKIYPGDLSARKAAFIADVKKLQARGVKVMVSLGGQNGHIELRNDAQRDSFLRTAISVIREYGFDGLDVDLEGSSITVSGDTVETCSSPMQKNLNYILHKLVEEFGPDFMITMAPEHPYVQGGMNGLSSPWGAYLPVLNNCRDILTFIHPQYYNNAIDYWLPDGGRITGYSADSLVALSEMLINGFSTPQGDFPGLRPDQVAFGVPASRSAAGSGTLSISEYQKALKTLIDKYPDFRGIMTWSTNWDEKENGSGFVNGMRSVIGERRYDTNEPLSVSAVTADKTGTVDEGANVTWSATAAGGSGAFSYQFELMKDGAVIDTQAFSSESKYSATLTTAGTYTVKATVKDGKNATAFKTSEALNVQKKVVIPMEFTNLVSSPSAPSVGAKATFNASVKGGEGANRYSFYIYKEGKAAYRAVNVESSSFSYTPQSSGTYMLLAYCKDSGGTVVSKTLKFTV